MNISAGLALWPGWVRTERVIAVCEQTNTEYLPHTETPFYVGMAVVALASDPDVMTCSGKCWAVGDLAREYNFTDIDGRQPPAFSF